MLFQRHVQAIGDEGDKDVGFGQRQLDFPVALPHQPGERSQSGFADLRSLRVMIAGVALEHSGYHFVLTYSNEVSVIFCHTEMFEALSEGLQEALWRLDGAPEEHRADNPSAATDELAKSWGRGLTRRRRELLEHCGLRGSKNTPSRAHENGDVEGSVANLTKGRSDPGRKTWSTYVSALARRSCSNVMASVRTHGPTPKARSTILASPTMPPWMANIRAWPLRNARITSKPLIVA